jgi:hypothetical protein
MTLLRDISKKKNNLFAAVLCLACAPSHAFDWTDDGLSYRLGNPSHQPYNPNVTRTNVFAHAQGSAYPASSGRYSLDLLQTGDAERALLEDGAGEGGMVYLNIVDIGKIRGSDIKYGAVRGAGLTVGADITSRPQLGYHSRTRRLVAGPTLSWNVPGYLNTSFLLMRESEVPSGPFRTLSGLGGRNSYDVQPMLSANWSIPVTRLWSFDGNANITPSRNADEAGNDGGADANIDLQMMFDAGAALGRKKNLFRIGLEYQYTNNKFGNTSLTTAGQGVRARTPMIRAEVHF